MRVEGTGRPAPTPRGATASVSRRELAIWLGTLASWRSGLVKRLLRRFGDVDAVLEQDWRALAGLVAGSRGGRADEAGRSADERRFAAALASGPAGGQGGSRQRPSGGRDVVSWCEDSYPPALRQLADPPFCLFVQASCEQAEVRSRLERAGEALCVAVVGTRAPSPYGREMAALLGRDLTLRGALVVSGMAAGVDAAAQEGAVAAAASGSLATVAVLGCGADVVYPRANARLYGDVLRTGLVVSEFAWGVPARAWRFPARNRIMAALARAVVIVEGTERSGARLTADYALDLGREVLAVPGEAGRRLTAAPHAFLRQGAWLCESAQDVADALSPLGVPMAAPGASRFTSASGPDGDAGSAETSGEAAAVLALLADGALSADQVAARRGMPAHEAAALLGELEVDGLVRLEAGGVYRVPRA